MRAVLGSSTGGPQINAYGLTGYAASPVDLLWKNPAGYLDSVRKGQTHMVSAITAFANWPCRDITHLVVAGYSQGAWALHGAPNSLPASTAGVIDTVLFVGDPLQVQWQQDTTGLGLLTAAVTGGGAVVRAAGRAVGQPGLGGALSRLVAQTAGTSLSPTLPYIPNTLSGLTRTIAACAPGDIIARRTCRRATRSAGTPTTTTAARCPTRCCGRRCSGRWTTASSPAHPLSATGR